MSPDVKPVNSGYWASLLAQTVSISFPIVLDAGYSGLYRRGGGKILATDSVNAANGQKSPRGRGGSIAG